jgi:hypothetical protein
MPYSNNHNLHVIVRDIEWDLDNDDDDGGLPETVVIPISYEELEDESALHEGITDYLSDNYGWLVRDYKLGWKKKDEV